MRRMNVLTFTLGSALFLVLSLSSCRSSKVSRASLVPFTKELKQKLEKENIDLKQIQFYIDQKLVLSRNLGDQKVQVSSGIVRLENGKYINEVIVPSFTPGVCENIDNDKMMISFEKGNNNLAFGP